MTRRVPILLLGCLLLAAPLSAAEDDMQEKIRQLEQQLQELKEMKARQDIGRKKIDQCLKAVGQATFCSCLGANLPADVSFEQYIHTVLAPKDELGYASMSPDGKKTVDATLATRERCAE